MSRLLELLSAPSLDVSAILRETERRAPDNIPEETRALLAKRLDELTREPAESTAEEHARWKRDRGYQFESLLFALAAIEGMKPSPPYKRRGEQIDGMFEMDGKYFLVETKWQADPTPASEIYAFRGKIEGKLTGTLGVFISMSGFSQDAPNALIWGKTLTVLLFDGSDLLATFTSGGSFRSILRAKLRRAAQEGQLYFTYKQLLDEHAA